MPGTATATVTEDQSVRPASIELRPVTEDDLALINRIFDFSEVAPQIKSGNGRWKFVGGIAPKIEIVLKIPNEWFFGNDRLSFSRIASELSALATPDGIANSSIDISSGGHDRAVGSLERRSLIIEKINPEELEKCSEAIKEKVGAAVKDLNERVERKLGSRNNFIRNL